MFEKVRNEDDLKMLYRGCWLIKYPLIERPTDEIDLSDERLFSLFEISSISESEGTFYLRNIDSQGHQLNTGITGTTGNQSANITISRTKDDLIREGLWWYRRGENPHSRE